MKIFETKVQYLKYQVLRSVAKHAFLGDLLHKVNEIPKEIISGKEATMRCCVYKERAILAERVNIAMGGDKENNNVIEVIEIACDGCPVGGYSVTEACRGCLSHRCKDACRPEAIFFDENRSAHIDKHKCVGCGACAKMCPYHAIISLQRPCETACAVKAIRKGVNTEAAVIDNDKCIACGACVYQCPFGSIVDKSYILDIVDALKNAEQNPKTKVYALVAPSISGQFSYAKLGQVVSGIKHLGFHSVVEVALGADMVALTEAQELAEKGFLTSSCCPAFVRYTQNEFPQLAQHISHQLSPMATLAKYIKEREPSSYLVFIGPCTAKKAEIKLPHVSPYVDSVLTFEELQALFDARDIDITTLEKEVLENASYFGRIFARSGGLSDAVVQAAKEQNLNLEVNALRCDGIQEAKVALLKKSKDRLDENFIEGMACKDGCIGGAGCLTHGTKCKSCVDIYGKEALEKTISNAVQQLL